MCKHAKEELVHDLKEIKGCLRVKIDGGNIIRSVDKCFNLSENYPKGDGDTFRGHMEECHHSSLLFHAKNTKGNRQDIITESAGPTHMNRTCYVEFLDRKLRAVGKKNILEENLFIILSSVHVVALFRAFSILFISVALPMRWLAGKSHALGECNWSVRSMGRIIDTLEAKMMELEGDPAKHADEGFMMNIFGVFIQELKPFKEYLDHVFEKKRQCKILKEEGKELPCNILRKELFDPEEPSNVETEYLMNDLGKIIAQTILKELRDPNKATHNHLSSAGGIYSWINCTELEKRAGVGVHATNNVAESSFGGLTEVLTNHSTVGFTSAGAMSMTRQNGDFLTIPILATNKGNHILISFILCY